MSIRFLRSVWSFESALTAEELRLIELSTETVQFENNEAEHEARFVYRPQVTLGCAVSQFRQALVSLWSAISRPCTCSSHWHPLAWHTAAERINSTSKENKTFVCFMLEYQCAHVCLLKFFQTCTQESQTKFDGFTARPGPREQDVGWQLIDEFQKRDAYGEMKPYCVYTSDKKELWINTLEFTFSVLTRRSDWVQMELTIYRLWVGYNSCTCNS